MTQNNRLYVLVRQDLDPAYQSVQAGHAVAQFMLDHPGKWQNEYLIYLHIKDLEALMKWEWKIQERDLSYSIFIEPDIGNQPTAIAVKDDGRVFAKLRLMS